MVGPVGDVALSVAHQGWKDKVLVEDDAEADFLGGDTATGWLMPSSSPSTLLRNRMLLRHIITESYYAVHYQALNAEGRVLFSAK